MRVPLEVSGHHCHLTEEDVHTLFGAGYSLQALRPISQPGQFAAKEQVRVQIGKGEIEARVVGPVRSKSQVEISLTEAYRFGITPPLSYFEDVSARREFCTFIGPKGKLRKRAVIIAQRHIHCDPATAKRVGLRNGQIVSVRTRGGGRDVTFHRVVVRVHPSYRLRCQLDTDEANAAGVKTGDVGTIVVGK